MTQTLDFIGVLGDKWTSTPELHPRSKPLILQGFIDVFGLIIVYYVDNVLIFCNRLRDHVSQPVFLSIGPT